MEKDNKLRLMFIKEILEKYTDEKHPLSITQIINCLRDEYGLEIHRTTIAGDIAALQDSGVDIQNYRETQNKYFMGERHFELAELKLLMDAVASSKFISKKKTDILIEKLSSFVSEYQAEELKQTLALEDRVKPSNEYVYYIADAIISAIKQERKITFLYFEYKKDKSKRHRNNSKPYVFSPYALVWRSDFYYVIGFSHKHGKIAAFRVDRIDGVPELLGEPIKPKPDDFSLGDFMKSGYKMYKGEKVRVCLRCKNRMMKHIIDRFGEDVETDKLTEDQFRAYVDVIPSPEFYAWVFSFNGMMGINDPGGAVSEFREMGMKVII